MSYILFGNKNTHTDYGLIVAPYEIPMPTAQTNFVPVPGHDGSLDLTEAFDAILFNDRIILLTLYATGEYDTRVSAFVNAVHGKRMQIVFSKDPNYYYTGPCGCDIHIKARRVLRDCRHHHGRAVQNG